VVSGLAGPFAVLVDVGTLHALHAELILHVAAAFGHDPTAPERAAELLYLQGLHDSTDEADAAVHAALASDDAASDDPPGGADEPTGSPVRLGRPLARSLTTGALRVGARRVLRLVPGAGAVIGAIANARATDEVAARAVRFYRNRR
jgi:hypothetical protein